MKTFLIREPGLSLRCFGVRGRGGLLLCMERGQIILQFGNLFHQQSGEAVGTVRVQMIRIPEEGQIGLKTLVVGVVIVVNAIHGRNGINGTVKARQKFFGHILIVVDREGCGDQYGCDVFLLAQNIDFYVFCISLLYCDSGRYV